MTEREWIAPAELAGMDSAVFIDCRFSLPDPGAGRAAYLAGHIPGAHYLALDSDLSATPAEHGGRHPLPAPGRFAATLAAIGVGAGTPVVAYDDSGLAFAARLWWMMRSLGFRPPRLLKGGYRAWLAGGGVPETAIPEAIPVPALPVTDYRGLVDISGVRAALGRGAALVDSREEQRVLGREEPLDPVAGHIPGAVNRPWTGVTDGSGTLLDEAGLRRHLDGLDADELVVYCGSGVTACVNLFALAQVGREDAVLYGGSWSDWCSWM